MPLVLKRPRVEVDLGECFDFIAQDKLEPAEEFLRVAARSFERLAEMPGIGIRWNSEHGKLSGVRVYPMPAPYRNYLIFYQPIEGGIEVLMVMQGSRDLTRAIE